MKKLIFTLFFALIIFPSVPAHPAGPGIPEITRPVNDNANIISPEQEKTIGDMILAHRAKTGVQMAVLTIYTTGGMSIEEFSLRTAEQWGGGSRERDDGLLFTVAVEDRRMRIEVGYGLEGYVTDLRAGRILDGIREDFRSGTYGAGIEKAVSEIIRATDELRPGKEPPLSARFFGAASRAFDYYIIFCVLGALAAVFLILGKMRLKFRTGAAILAAMFLFIAIPVLSQLFLHGAWYWTPIVYLTGALAGAGIVVGLTTQETKALKIIVTAFNALPALASLILIFYFLHIVKPAQGDMGNNEKSLIVFLGFTNLIQLIMLIVFNGVISGSGGSHGSGGSSSSGSSGGSSSSGSSSYSGGGGSYGGGGASSSW